MLTFCLGFGNTVADLRTATPIDIVKFEFSLNDQEDSAIIFNIGDRF